MFDVSAALGLAESADDALDLLVGSAVRTNLRHGAVMGSLLNEVVNLPSADRTTLRAIQREYTAEWIAMVTDARPGLSESEAHVRVQAAHGVIGMLCREQRLRSRPAFADEVAAIARAVLGLLS